MSEPKISISATLKEGYWIKIGDDSYAVHRILSVSIAESPTDEGLGMVLTIGGMALGMIVGALTRSWLIGIPVGLLLFGGVMFYVDKLERTAKERKGFPHDLTIELDKKKPRIVAGGIPKADAERLQIEIESIVAAAAKAEAVKM